MTIEIPKYKAKEIDSEEWVTGYIYKHSPPLKCFGPAPTEDEYTYYIVKTGFADWHMTRPVELIEIDPSTISLI